MAKAKNLMSSTWTKAAKVRRAFKAGRTRQNDLELTCDLAIHEAYILLLKIRKEMLEVGIKTVSEDLRALFILFSENKKEIELFQMPQHVDGLPKLAAEVFKAEKVNNAQPLGVAIWLRDREAGEPSVWLHSWLTNPDALDDALNAAEIEFDDGSVD
jgi:hypothetical protein